MLVQTKPTGLGYRQLEISEVVLISTGDPVNIVIAILLVAGNSLAVSLSVTTLSTITAITITVLVFAVTRGVIT
jgi:hypothetical protein